MVQVQEGEQNEAEIFKRFSASFFIAGPVYISIFEENSMYASLLQPSKRLGIPDCFRSESSDFVKNCIYLNNIKSTLICKNHEDVFIYRAAGPYHS